MRRILSFIALLGLAAPALVAPAHAGEAASLLRRQLEGAGAVTSGADGNSSIEAGARALAERLAAAPADNEAQFALGLARFARAVERYGQSQYRYGLQPPRNLAVPLLRFPVPHNPAPEELTYDKQRQVLQAFLDDLKLAEAELAKVRQANVKDADVKDAGGKGSEVKVVLDLNLVQLDLAGTGKPDDAKSLGAIMAGLRMMDPAEAKKLERFEVAFDNADALWLQGYCNLLSGLLETALAYDWHVAFEHAAGSFYPNVTPKALLGARQSADAASRDFVGERGQIADLVALVHDVNWPLVDPPRMTRAHGHFKKVVTLGRETWKAILAETDDDREWIPSPRQKNAAFKALPVGQQQVDGWLATLDAFEAALDGKVLVPHWRFAQGINLRKVFVEPRAFDLVLWATGHAAAPYLEPGEIMGQKTWDQWSRVFGGNFFGYALWFN